MWRTIGEVQAIKNAWIVLCLLAFTSSTFGQIAGSAHDFSTQSWSSGEICLPCHTPHNADTTVPGAPLWNHEVTVANFTLYSSPTMDVIPSQPQGVSRLCLSCHDGTIALDSYGGATGTNFITGDSNLGFDLSNDHPISIVWEHQTTTPPGPCGGCHSAHGGPITNPYLPFFDNKIECATCHDVHNTDTAISTPLLRLPLIDSELCLYCHKK